MYLGIDIGGTKTLVGCLDNEGVIQEQHKFLTPPRYEDFLQELEKVVVNLSTHDFRVACVAVPGKIDREHGRTLAFGNLKWGHVPIQADLEQLLHCPTLLENDANLGGLSEAMLLKGKYHTVLFLTISTGIGSGVISDGKIDQTFQDSEAGSLILEHNGQHKRWETFASGKAIVEHFGKRASDIHDQATWKRIAHNLAVGIVNLIAFMQPDIIVLGGSVSQYFDRFEKLLDADLRHYSTPLTPTPPIRKAQRPDNAVLYGCYDLAKACYGQPTR